MLRRRPALEHTYPFAGNATIQQCSALCKKKKKPARCSCLPRRICAQPIVLQTKSKQPANNTFHANTASSHMDTDSPIIVDRVSLRYCIPLVAAILRFCQSLSSQYLIHIRSPAMPLSALDCVLPALAPATVNVAPVTRSAFGPSIPNQHNLRSIGQRH